MEGRDHCPRDRVSSWHELKDGQLLFREEAEEYVRNLASAERIDRAMWVLDFGRGYEFVSEGLARQVGQLFLWDAAESMLVRARSHLAGRPNVHFLDLRNVLGEHKRYQKMKQESQLHQAGPDQLCRHAASTGLNVRILPRDLTHFSGRITAVFSVDSDDRRSAAAEPHMTTTTA